MRSMAVRASLRSNFWDANEDDEFMLFPQLDKVLTHKKCHVLDPESSDPLEVG